MKVLSKEINAKTGFIIYLFFYSIFLVTLSFFRDAVADETIYLRETMIISELLKKGIWIGDYGVGLHGFLFKFPVAMIFIILGTPSVFAATLFTIFISVSSVWLFYNIVNKYFFKGEFCFWAAVLFSASNYFIKASESFIRDIPAVFTVLLFLFLFLKNSNRWLIGLSLLLMLDAKEHVFFTVAPIYGLYILLSEFRLIKKKGITLVLKHISEKSFSGFILPILYIALMFTTSLIPVNMFIASILGIIKRDTNWAVSSFSFGAGSANLLKVGAKYIFKLTDLLAPIIRCNSNLTTTNNILLIILCNIIRIADIALAYIGKTLYPRTFSFISIPKIIVLPAIMVAYNKFQLWWAEKDKRYIFPLILLFNVLIVIFRASHGRYLLCVSPLFMLFFIMFIKEINLDFDFFKRVLIVTTLFVALGLLFESTFLILKIILEVSLLIMLWAVWLLRNAKQNLKIMVRNIFLTALTSGMVLTSLAFSYSIGQISNYLKYGYNKETQIIAESFNPEDVIWINNFRSNELLKMYRLDMSNEPEWIWELMNWVPKKHLLKVFPVLNTYTWNIINIKFLQNTMEYFDMDKIAIIISALDKDYFYGEEYLIDLFAQDWLHFEKKVELTNKEMYIFDKIDTHEFIF